MNKRVLAVLLATTTLFTIAGCSNNASADNEVTEKATVAMTVFKEPDDTAPASTGAADKASTEAATTGKVITPEVNFLEAEDLDLETLDDCMVAASFTLDDLYTIESGDLNLVFTIYDYDLYDMVDIAEMAVGDSIVIQGEEIAITSLETAESGDILINGGLDAGGYELTNDEGTVWYAIGDDDHHLYNEIGKAERSISENLVFTDTSDLEAGEVTYGLADLENKVMSDSFNEYNTTIRLEDNAIVEITRVYIP